MLFFSIKNKFKLLITVKDNHEILYEVTDNPIKKNDKAAASNNKSGEEKEKKSEEEKLDEAIRDLKVSWILK
jgi:hypothetical protein